jgi:DmsE family decaheme c-type cytochrome
VRNWTPTGTPIRWAIGLGLLGVCLFGAVACTGPKMLGTRRGDSDTAVEGADASPHRRRTLAHRPARPALLPGWQEKHYPPVSAAIPQIPDAEMVNDDTLCAVCHENYVKYHHSSVHQAQSCETCHGPGSQHIRTRGKEPGLIRSFKTMKPAQRSEVCLQCHQKDGCVPGTRWRTSAHAHAGVSCTDCHKGHYNVPPGTPATTVAKETDLQDSLQRVSAQEPSKEKVDMKAIRAASHFMGAAHAATCYRCHEQKQVMQHVGHPHQINGPKGFSCTTCHDPHGIIRKETRTELCLKCHKGHPQWYGSQHAQHGVACADCHNPHAPEPAIRAADPQTCLSCHQQFTELQRVAHSHQICGAVGMTCTTCHDPHGNIRKETRTDLCLQCHKGHPTMAWDSSIHANYGVACTDCHNPHPSTEVPQFVDIQHTHVRRPKRLPMSVEQPYVCYQCHAKIAALFELPHHHPVREGKMVCSDCHDPHGSNQKNLREPTVNLVCYRCHSEFSGPFAWEHPPVSENCAICHNPHGTVADNLLRQPTTFLCLRCHAGHRGMRRNIDDVQLYRPAFYTNCTQCHSQVHGSNLPAATRRGPRLTR